MRESTHFNATCSYNEREHTLQCNLFLRWERAHTSVQLVLAMKESTHFSATCSCDEREHTLQCNLLNNDRGLDEFTGWRSPLNRFTWPISSSLAFPLVILRAYPRLDRKLVLNGKEENDYGCWKHVSATVCTIRKFDIKVLKCNSNDNCFRNESPRWVPANAHLTIKISLKYVIEQRQLACSTSMQVRHTCGLCRYATRRMTV